MSDARRRRPPLGGPYGWKPKSVSGGSGGGAGAARSSTRSSARCDETRAVRTLRGVGDWYWIGVCAGLGVAIGVLLAGIVGATRAMLAGALVAAAGLGVLTGFGLGETDEAIGGGAGGVLGALGAAQLVAGTLRRGGGRFGTAVFIAIAALVLAALAWIPGVGFLEATIVPALAGRLRRRAPERYAGLRSLARD
jgi:hypothetical protein